MEELFNKPILDQMYEFRKDYFEQYVYDNSEKIRNLEHKVCDMSENIMNYLKKVIPNKKELKKIIEMLNNYELKYTKQIEFWNLQYFKLGMIEKEKIRNELFANNMELKENDTFLNYELNGFADWIEEQKRKYTFGTKEYKELQKKYNEISKKYPNAVEVFEDLKCITLTEEEMKALIVLRKIDIDMGSMEKELCFRLGMKEVINF